jgi:hypothetical protein
MIAAMTQLRWFLLAILTVLALPAHAADVVFPPGSRVGLAPPPGMTASKSFFGFEDAANGVAIIMVALPPEAYADIEKSAASDPLQREGVTLEKREPLTLPTGKAFLVVLTQQVESTKLRKWILTAAVNDLTRGHRPRRAGEHRGPRIGSERGAAQPVAVPRRRARRLPHRRRDGGPRRHSDGCTRRRRAGPERRAALRGRSCAGRAAAADRPPHLRA